ncbi:hypothetical protein [Actinospica robiniae]|uniref:hypothetical protein n=1 Tax=Actinospica robiniae TaxID=304901 RepID=UPI000556B75C|nr:hypothetical protein [Actinospica robiniae]
MMSWMHSRPLGMFFALAFVFGVLLVGVAVTAASALMNHGGVPWSYILNSAAWMFVLAGVATGAERSRRGAR